MADVTTVDGLTIIERAQAAWAAYQIEQAQHAENRRQRHAEQLVTSIKSILGPTIEPTIVRDDRHMNIAVVESLTFTLSTWGGRDLCLLRSCSKCGKEALLSVTWLGAIAEYLAPDYKVLCDDMHEEDKQEQEQLLTPEEELGRAVGKYLQRRAGWDD